MINLSPQNLQIVKAILNQFIPNSEVWIFGSRITDKYKPYSDIDLVVKQPAQLDQKLMFKLMDAFEESDLPIKVDILDWSSTSPDFQQVILKNYRVLRNAR